MPSEQHSPCPCEACTERRAREARRLAMLEELAEVGLGLAEAVRRDALARATPLRPSGLSITDIKTVEILIREVTRTETQISAILRRRARAARAPHHRPREVGDRLRPGPPPGGVLH